MNRLTLLFGCFAMMLALFVVRTTPFPIVAQEKLAEAAKAAEPAEGRVIVVVVDPAATSDKVKDFIAGLEKNGVVKLQTKQEGKAPDTPDQLQVTLKLKPTVEYKQVETFLMGLKTLQSEPHLRITIQLGDQNQVSVGVGSQVPQTMLEPVLGYLKSQTALQLDDARAARGFAPPFGGAEFPPPEEEQVAPPKSDRPALAETNTTTPPPANTTDVAAATEIPYRVTLLKLKSDWSKAADPDLLKTELRAALKDQGFADSVMEQLPKSGAEVLFSPDIVCTYSPAHFASLQAWLSARGLVVSATPVTDIVPATPESGMGRLPDGDSLIATVELDPELSLLPTQEQPNEPFIRREKKLTCTVRLPAKLIPGSKTRVLWSQGLKETRRGSKDVRWKAIGQAETSFQMASESVSVINALANFGVARSTANAQGFEYALIIEHGPRLKISEKPAPELLVPDQVDVLEKGPALSMSGYGAMPGSPAGFGRGGNAQGGYGRGGLAQGVTPSVAPKLSRGSNAGTGSPAKVTKTFDLKHVDASTAMKMVGALMPTPHYTPVGGSQTHRIIVNDDPQVVAELELLLKTIDQSGGAAVPEDDPEHPATGPKPIGIEFAFPITGDSVVKRRQDSANRELQTIELAAKIRQQRTQNPTDRALQQRLDKELAAAVAAAFESRQELLQTEVGEIQRRAQRIQQSIAMRNRVAKEIIARRVADLLNPDFKWDPIESALPATQSHSQTSSGTSTSSSGTPPAQTSSAGSGEPKRVVVEDPDADPKYPMPKGTVAWIELTIKQQRPDGTVTREAAYCNGTMVSGDGLIAFSTPTGSMSEQEMFDAVESVLVSFRGEEKSGASPAKLVAYHSETGLGLLKWGGRGAYLKPADVLPAIGRRLKYYYRATEDATSAMETECYIQATESAGGANGSRFAVIHYVSGGRSGGPLVDSANRLQGILGQPKPKEPQADTPPGAAEPESRNVPIFYAISGKEILKVIATYRGTHASNKGGAKPNHAFVPAGLTSLSPAPPQDLATNPSAELATRGRMNPSWTSAALEILRSDGGPPGKSETSAVYVGGTVISADGLIVSVLTPNLDEEEVLKSVRAVTVISTQSGPTHASVVAYDSQHGVVLLQSDMKNEPYLKVSKIEPALEQRCIGSYLIDSQVYKHESTISAVAATTGPDGGQYRARVDSQSPFMIGSSLVNGAGELQAIIASHIPNPTQGVGGFGTRKSNCVLIPSTAILQVLEKYRARSRAASRSPNDPEQIILQALLFEMDTALTGKLFDKPTTVKAPMAFTAPSDFERRLQDLGKAANVSILSRPQIRTLLNQRATIQIGQIVNRDGSAEPNRPKNQIGTVLEILPTRRIDSVLQLDLSVQVSKQGQVPQEVKAGDVILPATNVQAFRASVIVPAENQVLFACPTGDGESLRSLFIYLVVKPVASPPNAVLPAPAAEPEISVPRSESELVIRPDKELVMRNPSEYRKLLDDAAAQLVDPQHAVDGLLVEMRKQNAEATETDLMKTQPKLLENLSRGKKKQQLIRDELAAQIKLLQLEVDDSQLAVDLAAKKLGTMQELLKKKFIATGEVAIGQGELDHAQVRLKKANVLLELYLKVDPEKSKDVIGVDR